MICELLGAVECLAICVINLAAGFVGPAEALAAIWLIGIGGLAVSAERR